MPGWGFFSRKAHHMNVIKNNSGRGYPGTDMEMLLYPRPPPFPYEPIRAGCSSYDLAGSQQKKSRWHL